MTLEWRPPTRQDDGEWLGLLAAIEAVDRRGETYEQADLDDEWSSVWSAPATDAVFGWDADDLVAFGWLKTQPGTREHHKIELWGGVHPDRRRQGIGRELLARQLERAVAVAAGLDPALSTEARMDAGSGQADAPRLVERHGFAAVRTFREVARPLSSPVPHGEVPKGLTLLPWDGAWDEATRAAHTDAFAHSWENEPRTLAAWQQWYTGHRAFRADASVVLVDEEATVQAFVLCAAYPQDWHAEPRELWINNVGTRPGWRGRGAARAALTATLAAAAGADDGFERVILGVDAANTTGAVELYESLGFVDVRATTTYGRRLSARLLSR